MKIADRVIGPDQPPYVIAEMSGNHRASLDLALAIVDAAAAAGAHAVKLQTYTADSMALNLADPHFTISDPASLWAGRRLHDLYNEAHTPRGWHAAIFARAAQHGMVCFSSPFDESAVEFLETLQVPCYKIASFECVDLPLIRRVAQTGKPMIISTGMATITEIGEAVETARDAGCTELTLLKCTSTYPASPSDSNVRTIAHMRDLFACEIGLSDHTLGVGAAVAAVACGATVIEKHLTLSRADGGVDSAFSLEPAEFAQLVEETERGWLALGRVTYGPTAAEAGPRGRRRSLYVAETVEAGGILTAGAVRRVRPGGGLPPKYADVVVGRRVRRRIEAGTPLTWDLLE